MQSIVQPLRYYGSHCWIKKEMALLITIIELSYKDRGKNEVKNVTGLNEKNRIVIGNLKKYGQYNFSIRAHNDKGFGPKLIVSNRTHEDGKCIKQLCHG